MTEEDASMVGRRAVAILAVLLAAAFSTGCGKTITGRGTLAEDLVRPSGGGPTSAEAPSPRSEEHTSELQSHHDLVCRLLLEKKKKKKKKNLIIKKKKKKKQ